MATRERKAGELGGENDERKLPAAKRQRLEEDGRSTPTLSLLNLNNDCLLNILSKLHFNDLNNVAMTCRQLCQIRAHESLNQTREATIICRTGTTPRSFVTTIADRDWKGELVGNWTHLRIEHIERILRDGFDTRSIAEVAALTNIRSLDCSMPSCTDRKISYDVFYFLRFLLPNLSSLDLSNVTTHTCASSVLFSRCNTFRRMLWNHSRMGIFFDGWFLTNLVELFIDDCQFFRLDNIHEDDAALPEEDRLLWRCNSLERVSIKNVSFTLNQNDPSPTFQSVSQAMLIAFVRNKPTLRWFRSDLTAENVNVLKRERPDVIFES